MNRLEEASNLIEFFVKAKHESVVSKKGIPKCYYTNMALCSDTFGFSGSRSLQQYDSLLHSTNLNTTFTNEKIDKFRSLSSAIHLRVNNIRS